MVVIREATKNDLKVIEGIYEFVESLELDILKEAGKEKMLNILENCFTSDDDRFSHKYCDIVEEDGNILGFSFSYDYSSVESAKKYWYEVIIPTYNLSKNSIIFDYNEALPGEFYLDTLYVFENNRGKGVGTKLLKLFTEKDKPLKSLNVAQSNSGARKLYESFGFEKDGEIWIGHENYDRMLIKS